MDNLKLNNFVGDITCFMGLGKFPSIFILCGASIFLDSIFSTSLY